MDLLPTVPPIKAFCGPGAFFKAKDTAKSSSIINTESCGLYLVSERKISHA